MFLKEEDPTKNVEPEEPTPEAVKVELDFANVEDNDEEPTKPGDMEEDQDYEED